MTRSLRVWMFALAPLAVLALAAGAGAKPPDLPIEPNNDVVPWLAPLTPFGFVPPAGSPAPLAPPAPTPQIIIYGEHADAITITPAPMPQAVVIYHPVRPAVPLSTQRTLHWCVMFGAHPLLSLVPVPESLREERHAYEMIPVMPPPGSQLFGVGVNSDAGLQGSIVVNERNVETRPEPISVMPRPKAECEKPDEYVCPWMRCAPPCDRQVPAIADIDLTRTVLENLSKLMEADELYQKACELARHGRYADALECLSKTCGLCPASRFEEMAAELASRIAGRLIFGHRETEADTEEQTAPPTPCLPYQGDEGGFFGCYRTGLRTLPADEVARFLEATGSTSAVLQRRLTMPVTVNFREVSLRNALNDLSEVFDVKIILDADAVKGGEIDLDRPITLRLEQLSLKTTLELVTRHAGLTFLVKDDTIVVTTKAKARGRVMMRAYNVADLLACKGAKCKTPEDLIELITNTVAPGSWQENGGGGTIDFFPLGRALVVRQTADVQEQVGDILEVLRRLQARMRARISQHENKQECPWGCRGCCEAPGVAEQVTALMKACHLALSCGAHAKAAELARQAHALDAERVAADPVVYKMHLLALKKDKGCCGCCEDCDEPDCCCKAKQSAKDCAAGLTVPSGWYLEHLPQYVPPSPASDNPATKQLIGAVPQAKCVLVPMMPPPLPPIDPTIAVQLEKLVVEQAVMVAKSKPRLEVVEEESEAPEVPKAVAKPFRVRAADPGDVISVDDLLRLVPGETWTELDARTNHLRLLWRVRLGGTVYRLRYDGGDLSVDLSVTPPTGGAENCEKKRAVDVPLLLPHRLLLVEPVVGQRRLLALQELEGVVALLGRVDGHGHGHETVVRILLVQLYQVRELLLAGQSELGPDVHDHDLAALRPHRGLQRVVLDRLQLDLGGRLVVGRYGCGQRRRGREQQDSVGS
jgi:hypothetical protein